MWKQLVSTLSLFTSFSTLICCAIPALLVGLGFGAVLAGFVGTFPQFIWLSEHKVLLFIIAGVLLILGGLLQFNSRQLDCPTDPTLAEACQTTKGWSYWVYLISVGLYLIGAFFAFVAPRLFF